MGEIYECESYVGEVRLKDGAWGGGYVVSKELIPGEVRWRRRCVERKGREVK